MFMPELLSLSQRVVYTHDSAEGYRQPGMAMHRDTLHLQGLIACPVATVAAATAIRWRGRAVRGTLAKEKWPVNYGDDA
jgi:hypothetical protein